MKRVFLILFFIGTLSALQSKDWPVYKGNLYFTGNNDELIVKNNEIKWIFIANDRIFNPVVSEGKIYFIDIQKILYCINEENGSLLWRVDLKKFASQFESYGKVLGKIKYPLIYDNKLLITDSVAIYCFDKNSGDVIWARTGLVQDNYGQRGKSELVEGIYADPFIYHNRIYYGTRNVFYSRGLQNGDLIWENKEIKSYSAFGTFYGNFIFTQSRDYSDNKYYLFCIDLNNGKTVWKREIELPFQIFPPVVHSEKVIIPSGKSIYAFDLNSGKPVYTKNLNEYITSTPAFTDQYIRLTLSNNKLVTLNAESGEVLNETLFPEQSGPKFVTIRDQIYVAYAVKKKDPQTGKEEYYTIVEAHSLDDDKKLWSFEAKNPGSPSEPIAENGILFIPAGNMLYALGEKGDHQIEKLEDILKQKNSTDQPQNIQKSYEPEMKDYDIDIRKDDNSKDPIDLEIKQKKDGKTIYTKKLTVPPGKSRIQIPKDGEVSITATSKDHLPSKIKVKNDDSKSGDDSETNDKADDEDSDDPSKITLKKLEKDKNYIMNSIHFETGKAYLTNDSLDILDEIVKIMKSNPNITLEVQGHTDSTGTRAFNMKLSRQRANSVTEYLIKHGISPDRLKATGKGSDSPISDNKTKAGRAKNRRTEFIFQ